jgi:molybdopterin synthase catalytic subunit/molybdopterin converting factor small subunit
MLERGNFEFFRKDVEQDMSESWTFHLYAGLAERFDTRSLILAWTDVELTAGQIKQKLIEQYSEHSDILSICFIAQNQAYAPEDTIITRTDELALLPPVSGGSEEGSEQQEDTIKRYTISDLPLPIDSVIAQVSHPDHGAAIVFLGTTREWTQGKRTLTLEYEAYVPMAIASLKQIGEEISSKWPGTLCAIGHRIGSVGIGEVSVVIAVSSSHRADAYDASRYAIERLKQTVPIWKKEVYEDGTEWKGHQLGPWDPTVKLD